MYFFSKVFFIYTGQNFIKSATIWFLTVLLEVMMMADIQNSGSATTKIARSSFVVMSSRKTKTMDEGQVDRRELLFLVEKGILRKLLKG
jgi:hypothetical protein